MIATRTNLEVKKYNRNISNINNDLSGGIFGGRLQSD